MTARRLAHRRARALGHETLSCRWNHPIVRHDQVPARLGLPPRLGDCASQSLNAPRDLRLSHEYGRLRVHVPRERCGEFGTVEEQVAVLGRQYRRGRRPRGGGPYQRGYRFFPFRGQNPCGEEGPRAAVARSASAAMSTCCFIVVSFQIRGSSDLGYIAQRAPAKDGPRPVEFSRDITARVPATAPPPRQPGAVTSLPTPTCCASHRRNPVVPPVAPTLLSDTAEPRPQNPRGTEGAHGAD